ncbi:MAG: molybdopterin-dependent oxidoreductase [Thermoplasmata archaeon]
MEVNTVCARDCYDACLMKVIIEEGGIKRVQGSKAHPFTNGFLCPKGYNYIKYQYHEERLRFPMKRCGKKGEGKFEKITWEEALKIISEKINEVSTEFSPLSILVYEYAGHMGFLSRFFPYRIFNKLNASFVNHTLCDAAGNEALNLHFGTSCGVSPLMLENAKLIVVWGANLYNTSIHAYQKILRARNKGAILIVVDPIKNKLAENADVFLQVKPGTDALLAYSIIKILIESQLVDYEFINTYTSGFEELKAVSHTVDLNQAEKITGISVEKLRDVAGIVASLKPAIFVIGYGMQRRAFGGNAVRAVAMLPILTGNITRESGIIYNNAIIPVDFEKFTGKHLRKLEQRIFNMQELGKVLTNSKLNPPVKMVFVYNSNPCATLPNRKSVLKGFEREDLFTVVHDIFLTETALYADILLPAKTMFEFDDVIFGYFLSSVAIQNKVVDADGEAVSNAELARMLAKAMNFIEKELYEEDSKLIEEVIEFVPQDARAFLKNEGYLVLENNPAITGFGTKTGKIEIASTTAWKIGAPKVPLPIYEKTDDFWLLTPLSRDTIHTQFSNISLQPQEIVYLSPGDAERIDVCNGDIVVVESINGKLELAVEIWEAVQPGTAIIFFSKYANVLTTDEKADLGAGSTYNSTQVKIKKKT